MSDSFGLKIGLEGEKAIVNRDKTITFMFTSGTEITL